VKSSAAEAAADKATTAEGGGALLLWAGVLGPPTVFLTNLIVSYAMAYWACTSGKRWALDLVTLVSLALVGLCGLTAWRLYAGTRDATADAAYERDRTRFMGVVGVLTSALFVLATLALMVPRLVIGPCFP
jgi:hypothetical protein